MRYYTHSKLQEEKNSMNQDIFQKERKKKTLSRTFNGVLEDSEVSYLSNSLLVEESVIMWPNALIKISLIKVLDILKKHLKHRSHQPPKAFLMQQGEVNSLTIVSKGSLLYLTDTRPNIMHAVGIVGRFQENPKESHLQAIKRIFKYLQGTYDFGLWYPRDTDLTLHAYTDADWVGSVDDRKSTSGSAFYMGFILVSWFGKKQSSIALSTAEAEYVVVASCCTQLLWMMQTLQDNQITCTPPISILCDNTSVISISKNPVMHSKTKHIPIKYHFLREQVLEQKVKLEYVPSKEQVDDIFTKSLPRETFEYLK
eukprot:PITA_19329